MQRKPGRKANYPAEFVSACKTSLRNVFVRTQLIGIYGEKYQKSDCAALRKASEYNPFAGNAFIYLFANYSMDLSGTCKHSCFVLLGIDS